MNLISDEDLEEIYNHLVGSCDNTIDQSAADLLEEKFKDKSEVTEFDLEDEITFRLNDRIFRCESCGWWHDMDELADDDNDAMNCTNCSENEESND